MQTYQIFELRASIRCAFKGEGADFGDFARPEGAGFSGELLVGWRADHEHVQAFKDLFARLIHEIDGQHFGFVTEKGISTPETLLQYCRDFCAQKGFTPVKFRLYRKPDIIYLLSTDECQ